MKNNRSMIVAILLSIITFGIYGIYFYYKIGSDLNTLAPNKKPTINYVLVALIFSWLTCGIVPIVWYHRISAKTGEILKEKNINYSFDAATFWLWCVLGSLIIVGPFVYLYKQCTAMNMLADEYNKANQ